MPNLLVLKGGIYSVGRISIVARRFSIQWAGR